MLYRILKVIVGIGIRLYYKEIKVKNGKFLEHDGPMIIIANHPNTLMDAWIIGNICPQPIYFMAKGTFFNSPFKRKILNSLKMIPINRQIDGEVAGVKNKDSFEACYKLLEEGKTLVIFPEGNSLLERQLRQLKSGTARIALEAENRNSGKLNLKIIPLGLFYSQAEKFRSSVMITVEKGLFVTDFLPEFLGNSSLAAKKLTTKFRLHLERVLVTTESKEQEKLINAIYTFIHKKEETKNVEKNAEFLQQIKVRMEEIQLFQPYLISEIQQLVDEISWQSNKLKIQSDFIRRRFRSRLYLGQISLSVIFLLVGLPLFLFGFLHNSIPFYLTDKLVPRLTKYVEYFAPISVLLGLILYPLTYFGFLFALEKVAEPVLWIKFIYFISLPLTGMFAFAFVRWSKRIGHKWHYIFLIFNQKDALKNLKQNQKELEKLVLSI